MASTHSFIEQIRTPGAVPVEELERIQQAYADILTQTSSDGLIGRIPRTYAEALLAAGVARGVLAAVTSNFASFIRDLFPAVPGLEEYLDSPVLSKKSKDEFLVKMLDGRAEPLFLDFLRLLNQKDRLGLLRLIWEAYRNQLEHLFNRQRVLIESAIALTDEQKSRLSETLANIMKRTPVLVVRVKPELIGGLVIRTGDHVFDTSVRTKLQSYRTQLLARGTHEIQSGRDRFGHY
jgi:F-type H+-transporting ATPase subunit delta